MADALAFMLDSRERREQMGQASRARAERLFDETAVIAANLGVYRSMLPGRIPEFSDLPEIPVAAVVESQAEVSSS